MLASLREVVAISKKNVRAVGAFNTPNLECLLAVLGAAEKLNVPVICSHAQLHESVAPLDTIGPVMLELAKRSKVPVCVHLDHGEDFEYCKRAIDLGFTSVMIDYSTLPYERMRRARAKSPTTRTRTASTSRRSWEGSPTARAARAAGRSAPKICTPIPTSCPII